MKSLWRLPRHVNARLVWLPFTMLVALIALLNSLGSSTNANEHSPAELSGVQTPGPSIPAGDSLPLLPAAVSMAPRPGMKVTVGVTAPFSTSYTVHLPLIHASAWEAPNSLLGVQVYWSSQEVEMKTAQMGARWVRLPINWSWIEPQDTEPANYSWPADFDQTLARLSSRNIQVILTLSGNPSWAATWPNGRIDLVDISELAEFMAAAAARYGQPPYNVKHWEFYNEPDCGVEGCGELGFSYWGDRPDAYADMLAAVYQPMKAADPEAQIVFGGIAYDWWIDDGGPFAEEFLDGVLAAGGGDSFDVMNFHYYPQYRANWEPYGPDIIGKATYIRNKLAFYGLADRPLICTEASQWSNWPSSDELQSRYVAQLFARSMAADLRITIWFMLVDSSDIGLLKYGLLNPDLSPKPSYAAYSTFARQMAFARYVRALPPAETGSDQIEAYEFTRGQGPIQILVAWTEDGQQHSMGLAADWVVVVDKFGVVEATVYDGDDGLVDGRTQVTLGPSPLYLRPGP